MSIKPKKERLNKDGKKELLIQKSQPLYSLWRSALTLEEFKVLDVYLARINSRDEKTRKVVFAKTELENLLGVQKVNNSDLRKRINSLLSPVTIFDKTDKETFKTVPLFEEVFFNNQNQTITFSCSPLAKKYFFDIEKIGYFRYKLHSVSVLASRYSYMMFLFLENNRFRGTFSIDVLTLKHILGCEKEKTYDSYKRLNDLLLKKVQAELHTKTDIRYEYRPIRSGREVVQIEFSVMENKKIELLQTQDSPQEQDLGLDDWNFDWDFEEPEVVVDVECEYKEEESLQEHEKEVSFFRDNGEPKPMPEFLRELKETEEESKKNPKKTPSEIAEEKIRQIYADDSLDQDTKIERVKAVIKAKFTGELK